MRRLVAALAVAIVLAPAGAGPADAHAGFVSSEPGDGASLPTSPERIAIVFTETPDLGFSSIQLLDAGGTPHPLGALRADPPHGISADVDEILPDGVYTVAWEVVSTEDGHKTANSFAFAVGDAVAPQPGGGTQESVTKPTPGSVASKVGLYAGLGVLIACAGVGLGVLGDRPRRLHVVALAAAAAAFAGATGLLVSEQRAIGVSMANLLASPTGRPYLWIVVGSLVAAAFAVLAAARPGWRRLLWLAGAAAAATAFVRASSGHAASPSPALPQELVQWVHIVAASLWIGGLLLVALTLRDPGPPPVTQIRRFSTMALFAVGVLVLTGVLRTLSEIGGPGALLDALGEGYAIALVVKVSLALLLIGLGAVNRFRSIPRLPGDPRPLRRILRAEIAVAAGIVVLTATLTGLDPAAGTASAAPASPVLGVAAGTDFAETTRVELTTTPGTPGTNALRAVVTDPETGAGLSPDDVTLRFASVTVPDLPATDVALRRQGEAWTGQGLAPSVAGTWRVTARVLTGAEAVEVPMMLITRSGATTVPTPGAPLTTASYPSGVSIQISVEDAAGRTTFVHVTAIAPDATELPVANATVVAVGDDETATRLPAELASPGHAIAQTELDPGTWTFDAVVTLKDDRSFQATALDVPLAG